MSSNQDKTEGTVNNLKGKAEEAVGNVTGDQSQQNQGKADQTKGHVQQGIGDAKSTVNDAKQTLDDVTGGNS